MSQANKRSRLSSSGAYRQRENQSSNSSTNVAQTQSGLIIDNETELSSDLIKDQLDSVDDILTQPIIEVPTKRLLHLKELGGNLFVSSSTKIYSKTLQKLFDRVLFTKSLNNDVNTAPTDLRVFERVLARSDDNDAYSTCTSLAQPVPANILVLGSTATEHALIWKLLQRRNFKIFISPGNTGTLIDHPNGTLVTNIQNEKDILDCVDSKQIDLVISLNKRFYYEELEARLCERGLHYLGCSVDTLALSDNRLNAKQFMSKHKIPTLDWLHCSNVNDAQQLLDKYPDQQQWLIDSIPYQTRDETLEKLRNLFENNNQSPVILEHGYAFDEKQICLLYIVSDGDGDYTKLPLIQSDSSQMGAYGPCPFLTSKQSSYIRRRIVERTLRCSPTIRHLFGFRLLINGSNYNDIFLLDYISTFNEPESELLLSLCEPDIYLQYALDLPSIPVLSLTNKKRRVHCVNTTMKIPSTSQKSYSISNQILQTAIKNNKVKIFHNQTELNLNNDIISIPNNAERLFNVLGYGSTLQEAQIQSILACEYIKQHSNIDEFTFRNDIGQQAIEWYERNHSTTTTNLTNGRKKRTKINRIGNKQIKTEIGNVDDEDDDDDDDESEPMDFERAFGTISETPKIEHLDIYQTNGNFDDLNLHEGESFYDLKFKIDLNAYKQAVLVSTTINLNSLAALFNLNDGDMNDSQTVFEYLGHELTVRCANDLICARTLYIQCCSYPLTSRRSIQRFYQGIEQACQQLNCTLLKTNTTTSNSLFVSLCTGLAEKELITNNNLIHPNIIEQDFLIALRCSSGMVNTQGYMQLKDLFQKKNIHLNDTVPFRTVDGDEESFFSLLLQKTSILSSNLARIIAELIANRTIKAVRYLKDIGLARMIESLLGPLSSTLSAELNGQQWPVMPPLFTWIYQHSGFSQDEMFEYFNCGVDYLLLIDHTKISIDDILQQLNESHTSSFFLGTFVTNNASPVRKPVRLPQQTQQPIVTPSRQRTVQLKNISFKYPKPYQIANANLMNNNLPIVIKDRMKQPIANDKTRCAVLISTNDTSLLSVLAYSTSTLECGFEIVLVLATLASLSDIARVNELYPSVVTKVIQPKKYAARHYDLDQKVDDELQLHGCELVILDRYACRLSPSFILAWRGRLLNIYPSLLPSFRHSSSPIRDAIQAGVRITGVTVHFIGDGDHDHDGPIIAQESISISPNESELQLENRLHTLEQQLYPKAIDLVASGKIVYQGKRRLGKSNSTTTTTGILSSTY